MTQNDNEFDAVYWEDRYRTGGGASRHDPSPSLIAETAGLPSGHALDAGCGHGADAVWLASRGWHVTAVDVSPAAVEQARQAAVVAADPYVVARIEWIAADLTSWEPGTGRFDLVTSHYVHVPGPPEELFARLASWVAPGGTLLVVGHGHSASHGHSHDHDHTPPATAQIRIAQITTTFNTGDWEVIVAEPRTHSLRRPDGSTHAVLHDIVVRARRTQAPQP